MDSFNLADALKKACSYGPRKNPFPTNNVKILKLDGRQILANFHEYFAEIFGFPDYYGKNMDAWIDSMSDLRSEYSDLITKNNIPKGSSIVFYIENYEDLKQNREVCDDLIECISFVNKREIESDYNPLIYLAF
jgi:hypothetical protein